MKLWIILPLLALLLIACSQEDGADLTTTASGLQYEVLASGDGESPSAGDTAVVHYTGWLTDGTKFDSSVDRGQPFEFGVGRGNVIPGLGRGRSVDEGRGQVEIHHPAGTGLRRAQHWQRPDPSQLHPGF